MKFGNTSRALIPTLSMSKKRNRDAFNKSMVEGLSQRMQGTSLVSPKVNNFKEYYSPVFDGEAGGNFNNNFSTISKASKHRQMYSGLDIYKHTRNKSTKISETNNLYPKG